jgi:hypothetical protein
MKKKSLYVAAIITAAAVTFPGVGRAATDEVYRVSVSLHGLYQATNELTQAKEIQNAVFNAKDIINLALGRSFNSAVSSNQLLAYVSTGGSTNSLIVYDKSSGSNLMTVADVTSRGSVSQGGLEDFIWKISFLDLGATNVIVGGVTNTVGSSTNTFTGGTLQVEGWKLTKNGKFEVISTVNGVVNADSDGDTYHVLVPSGELTFGSPAIGKIITTP